MSGGLKRASSPRLILSNRSLRLPAMLTFRRPALAAFFALVVLCGQVFGLQRGFVCESGGFEHETALDHCHGLSDHEEHELPAHDRNEHHEGEPVHDHAPLKVSQEADNTEAAAFACHSAPILAFWVSPAMVIKSMSVGISTDRAVRRPESRAGPLWPPRLARTISLRI